MTPDLVVENIQEFIGYCISCGQALDWSDDGE